MQVFVSKNYRNFDSLVRRRATYHVQVKEDPAQMAGWRRRRHLNKRSFFVKKDRL